MVRMDRIRNDFSSDPIKQPCHSENAQLGLFFPFGDLQEIVSYYVISKSGSYWLGKVIYWIFKSLPFLCHVARSQWSAGALEVVQPHVKHLLLKIQRCI